MAHEQGDIPRTLQLLRGALPCLEQPNIYLLLASILTETGSEADRAEAEKLLDELLASDPQPGVVEEVQRLKMLIAIEQEDWTTAEAIHTAMREADPDNIEVLVDGARLTRLQDNRPHSIALLSEAERKLTTQTSLRHRHALAVEWYALQEYQQAAKLYEYLANREANSPFTLKLLHCYFQAGDLGKALELGQHLLELYGPMPTVSEMVTAIYELVNNLPKARQTAELYLERFPHDFSMRLRLALVCLRARDQAGIDAFLNTPIDT